jgi:hypothetical protein
MQQKRRLRDDSQSESIAESGTTRQPYARCKWCSSTSSALRPGCESKVSGVAQLNSLHAHSRMLDLLDLELIMGLNGAASLHDLCSLCSSFTHC